MNKQTKGYIDLKIKKLESFQSEHKHKVSNETEFADIYNEKISKLFQDKNWIHRSQINYKKEYLYKYKTQFQKEFYSCANVLNRRQKELLIIIDNIKPIFDIKFERIYKTFLLQYTLDISVPLAVIKILSLLESYSPINKNKTKQDDCNLYKLIYLIKKYEDELFNNFFIHYVFIAENKITNKIKKFKIKVSPFQQINKVIKIIENILKSKNIQKIINKLQFIRNKTIVHATSNEQVKKLKYTYEDIFKLWDLIQCIFNTIKLLQNRYSMIILSPIYFVEWKGLDYECSKYVELHDKELEQKLKEFKTEINKMSPK